MVRLEVNRVSMVYENQNGPTEALRDISFSLESGESLAILGPSGAGKSTLLGIIDGLLKPTSGDVRMDGQVLTRPRARTGLILQDLGLMPWKTVLDNAALGLLVRGIPKDQARSRAAAQLEAVGLKKAADRYPAELSGGMKQRLALARAMVLDVDLLLMDEPLSALDALLRQDMQDEFMRLKKEHGYAQILVTHSVEEAVLMGKRVIVMGEEPGRIIEILDNPGAEDPSYRDSEQSLAVCVQLRQLLATGGGRG